MEMNGCLLFCLLALVSSGAALTFTRKSFPDEFIFGAGSSAYQYEGAARIDGKGPSAWDTFTRLHPENIDDHSNGDVAEDFYHRYKEDVKLMKEIGLDSFRFSISWPRILPRGKISGGVNQLGVKFYNDLINELLAHEIKPFVSLFHFDSPQELEDEYLGFLSPKVVDDFVDYADLCFREFGDRVKFWVTLNEPNIYAEKGYGQGTHAPNRCSSYIGNCTSGNSATEPYIAGHHLLLAHAAAVKLYREKYQAKQKGIIGISVATHWFQPINNALSNRKAASRSLDFLLGWNIDPLVFGDYPRSMRSIVRQRLPRFTKEQSEMLKNSFDFIGLNYYTSFYAVDKPSGNAVQFSYTTDSHADLVVVKNGVLIGEKTPLSWIHLCPNGLTEILLHIKNKYNNPTIIITENGMADANNSTLPIEEALKDRQRIKYHFGHLAHLLRAMKMGVKVEGYYVWTFLDDFEWNSGYTVRFGLNYVDYKNGLKRYKKRSAVWYKRFLRKQT